MAVEGNNRGNVKTRHTTENGKESHVNSRVNIGFSARVLATSANAVASARRRNCVPATSKRITRAGISMDPI